MIPWTAVWLYDTSAGAYVDHTIEATRIGGTVFEGLAETGDCLYLGLDRRPKGLVADVTTLGSYGQLKWEVGIAKDNWDEFVPVKEYTFQSDRYGSWDLQELGTSFAFDGINPHASVPPDTTARFWVRVSSSVSVTTAATINWLRAIPFALYCSVGEVSNALQLSTSISSSTTPSDLTVEKMIARAQGYIDWRAKKSWQYNVVEEELLDWVSHGIKVKHAPIIDLFDLAVWEGSSFVSKTEGRDNEFWVEPKTGMIYFTHVFWFPFTRPFTRGHQGFLTRYGAYRYPIRISYAWGNNWQTASGRELIRDIALKQACIEVVRTQDYTALVSLGLRAIQWDEKIREWQQEIEERLDRLTGFTMY